MATDTPFPTSPAETQSDGLRDTALRDEPMSGSTGTDYMQRSTDTSLADQARDTARRAETNFADEARDTGARADDLIGRIAQSAHETIDRLAETAAPHVNRLQENLSGDALHMRADEMRELRDEWTESLRCTVRENPLAAVGVALAVGLLIARLSR
jgi:ElaB/YqjD/DUF883 family membrane-anchored ribosome-binding protein